VILLKSGRHYPSTPHRRVSASYSQHVRHEKFLAVLFGELRRNPYLCVIKRKDMEEKRYPTFAEEESVGIAAEPTASAAVTDMHSGVAHVQDELDGIDWDSYPIFGPQTQDEAIARIDTAWEDRNDSNKWMTSEQMWDMIYQKYPWLR